MTRRVAGFAAALFAGAWLGSFVEWSSESGGWHGTHETQLAAAAGRGAFHVAIAFGVVEACLWRRPDRWLLRLVATSLLGAAFFIGAVFVPGQLEYFAAAPVNWDLSVEARDLALRLLFFAGQLLLIMGAVAAAVGQMSRRATSRS